MTLYDEEIDRDDNALKIAKECNELSAHIALADERDYRWTLDYAKYRHNEAREFNRVVETKAANLLRNAGALAAAVWLVLTYAASQHLQTNWWLIGLATVFLIATGAYALGALYPRSHIMLPDSEIAICLENEEPSTERAQARFALNIEGSTRVAFLQAGIRGDRVRLATVFFSLAALSLAISACLLSLKAV